MRSIIYLETLRIEFNIFNCSKKFLIDNNEEREIFYLNFPEMNVVSLDCTIFIININSDLFCNDLT